MSKKNKHHTNVPVQFPPNRQAHPAVLVKQESQQIRIQQSNMPDIETLEGYARFIPNGAERLMTLIETQTAHRIEMEKTVVPNQMAQAKRGQIFGFISSIVCISVAVVFLFLGYKNWAGAIVTTTAVSMATIFALGKNKVNKNLEEKRPQITVTPKQEK